MSHTKEYRQAFDKGERDGLAGLEPLEWQGMYDLFDFEHKAFSLNVMDIHDCYLQGYNKGSAQAVGEGR